jgi:hypothetical protein
MLKSHRKTPPRLGLQTAICFAIFLPMMKKPGDARLRQRPEQLKSQHRP